MTIEYSNANGWSKPDVSQIDVGGLEEKSFSGQETDYRIVLEEKAYKDILSHGNTDLQKELCGILMGILFKDAYGPYLVVTDTIRGKNASEGTHQVTLTHSTWEYIHSEMEKEEYVGKHVVGWYHTHPGFGVFLSEIDLFAHRNFFNAPWQVAMVVDQKVKKAGVFFWEKGEVVRARRFWVGDVPHWETEERSAAFTPPRSTTRNKFEEHATETSIEGQKPGHLSDIILQTLPILLLTVLFCVSIYMYMTARLEDRRLEAQVNALKTSLLLERQNDASHLAYLLAVRTRERLDTGTPPETVIPTFKEILRVDSAHRSIYEQLLPELAAILYRQNRLQLQEKTSTMPPHEAKQDKGDG